MRVREDKRIRTELAEALLQTKAEEFLQDKLSRFSQQAATRSLLGFLSSADATLRSRSARALGFLVAERANRDLEGAREIVRRLMWSLNDESGGIGWGAPEAMAQILARSDRLWEEFAPVFVSYLREDANFLGGSPLEPCLLEAASILAEARPDALRSLGAEGYLAAFLRSPSESSRKLAARALGSLRGATPGAASLAQAQGACRSVSQGARSGLSNGSR